MRDPSAMECRGWNDCALGDAFRINRESVVPLAAPAVEFVHYSIPAWDAARAPALQRGAEIESNKTAIRSSSVLVSKLNPRKPRVAAVIDPPEHTCCSTEFICYQPKRDSDDLRFWSAYFTSNDFAGRLANIAIGSTNSHTRAAPPETLAWRVPDVPGVEQRTIARVLDTLDTAIQRIEAVIAKLKQVKQGLLHDLLTRGIDANGELRPPQPQAPNLYKPSPLGWIPKEWAKSTIDGACSHVVDCPHSTPVFREDGVLVARTMHIKAGVFLEPIASRVSEAEYQRRIARLCPETGDVVFTREAPVGEAFVIPPDMKICLGQRVMLLRPREDKLCGEFLVAQIYSGVIADRVASLTAGTTNPHLNVAEVRRFMIPLPPVPEQSAIQQHLSGLDARLRLERKRHDKFLIMKSGLMDDLLTGCVRVTPLLEAAAAP